MFGLRPHKRNDDDRDLGFGAVVASSAAERLLNRDGSFNSRREGLGFFRSLHLFDMLLTMSWPRFLLLVAGTYLVVQHDVRHGVPHPRTRSSRERSRPQPDRLLSSSVLLQRAHVVDRRVRAHRAGVHRGEHSDDARVYLWTFRYRAHDRTGVRPFRATHGEDPVQRERHRRSLPRRPRADVPDREPAKHSDHRARGDRRLQPDGGRGRAARPSLHALPLERSKVVFFPLRGRSSIPSISRARFTSLRARSACARTPRSWCS